MIWTLVRKEIAGHLLSLRFSLALALFAAVTLTSVLAMYRQFEQRAQDHALCQAREGEPRASIPPVLTSVLAWGLEDVTGRTVDLTQSPMVLTYPLQSPFSIFDGFFPTLDMTYVARVVGALVALGFAFDAFCGEGRGGTLALSLAAGASRSGILVGKLAGGLVVIASLVLLPVTIGLSLLWVGLGAPFDLPLLLRILLWVVSSLLYLGGFYSLGLLISALVEAPKVALMGCLILWTVLTFILPGTLTSFLRLNTGLQSPTRFEQANFYTMRETAISRNTVLETQFQRREARAHEMLAFSHQALRVLRLLPGPAYLEVSTDLAGTGANQMPAYFAAVQRFMRGVAQGRQAGTGIPAFAYQRAGVGECLQESAVAILSLLVWSAVACWGLTWAWARYDVRVKEAGPQ